jgi:hypothetical protein
MKSFVIATMMIISSLAAAQVQTKAQCISTIRARSMSVSSADAEKLCSDDYPEVVNCAVTAMQSKVGGNTEDRLKSCREQWGVKSLRPEPKSEAVAPAPAPAVVAPVAEPKVKVPVDELESAPADEDEVSKK